MSNIHGFTGVENQGARTFTEISNQIAFVLHQLIDPSCERTLTDVEQYQECLELGMEPTREQMYPIVGAVCLAGELGLIAEEVLRETTTPEQNERLESSAYGHNLYYIPSIATTLYAELGDAMTDCDIFQSVVGILAHERRHAVQQYTQFGDLVANNTCTPETDLRGYFLLEHELDAGMFSTAVLTNRAAMADVCTYQPTRLDRDRYIYTVVDTLAPAGV